MNALSHEFDLSQAIMLPPLDRAPQAAPDAAELAARWLAVHEAADAVAQLAQLGRQDRGETVLGLPGRAAKAGGWSLEMAARGIDDLAAVMEPGLRALIGLTAAGQDTTVAALTLWREFHAAREAILAFAPPGEAPAL